MRLTLLDWFHSTLARSLAKLRLL